MSRLSEGASPFEFDPAYAACPRVSLVTARGTFELLDDGYRVWGRRIAPERGEVDVLFSHKEHDNERNAPAVIDALFALARRAL